MAQPTTDAFSTLMSNRGKIGASSISASKRKRPANSLERNSSPKRQKTFDTTSASVSPTQNTTESRFAQCSICHASIPLFRFDEHVSSCLPPAVLSTKHLHTEEEEEEEKKLSAIVCTTPVETTDSSLSSSSLSPAPSPPSSLLRNAFDLLKPHPASDFVLSKRSTHARDTAIATECCTLSFVSKPSDSATASQPRGVSAPYWWTWHWLATSDAPPVRADAAPARPTVSVKPARQTSIDAMLSANASDQSEPAGNAEPADTQPFAESTEPPALVAVTSVPADAVTFAAFERTASEFGFRSAATAVMSPCSVASKKYPTAFVQSLASPPKTTPRVAIGRSLSAVCLSATFDIAMHNAHQSFNLIDKSSTPPRKTAVSLSMDTDSPQPLIDWSKVPPRVTASSAGDAPGRVFFLSPSVLKSLLQKNVRLSRPMAAVRTALQLMKLSFNNFIRRLAIIMVEDAVLHPALPLVVWLMAAAGGTKSKASSSRGGFPKPPAAGGSGPSASANQEAASSNTDSSNAMTNNEFVPSVYHVETLLQIVYEIAAVNAKDFLPSSLQSEPTAAPSNADSGLPPFTEIQRRLPPLEAALVRALLARAAFGGMKGDVVMLRQYARTWYQRFSENVPPPPAQVTPMAAAVPAKRELPYLAPLPEHCTPWLRYLYSLYGSVHTCVAVATVGPLGPDDVVLSAVDFHCSPVVSELLANRRTSQLIEQYLKRNTPQGRVIDVERTLGKMMWWFRSSLTNKAPLIGDAPPVLDENELCERERLSGLWHLVKDEINLISYEFVSKRMNMVYNC